MQETAGDIVQLIRSAGAKLAGHWPTLLALVLAGFTVKLATLKLALLAGDVAWALGVFVFAFSAAGLLAAVLLMFRAILPTREWPPFTMVLPPFLLIFVATNNFDGYLVEPALERQVTMDVAAAVVLIAAIALRWLMPLWTVVNSRRWAGWVRLGLDICWMSLTAFTLATHPLSLWLTDLAAPVSWLFSALFAVLVVPLAWLAVGGLALGLRPSDAPQVVRLVGVPMIAVSCLLILVLETIPLLLLQIERLIIGSQDPQTFWQPVSGLVGAANSAIGVLLVVCLVGAFADRLAGGDEPGVAGQRSGAHDADSDRFGVGRSDEEDGHLIGI